MGKKSNPDPINSLFSDDNPFRRKPQPATVTAAPSPAPPSPAAAVDAAAGRRDRDGDPNPNPSPKRKKPDAGEDGAKKTKKKRKRDELEERYETKRYGKAPDGEAAVVPVVGAKRKAAEAVSDETVVEKEGFDDESKLLRTVFVGNLPLKTKRKVLMNEFARFGEVESVRIRSVPIVDSKIPRKGAILKGKINDAVDSVNAYIVFKDEQSATAALSHNLSQVGGNHIRVDMACPPRKKMKGEAPLYDRKKTLFVGNLPFDVKDEELYQLFCGSSPSESGVEAIRVVRDPHTSLGKGIAYVLFKSREAASSTVRKRDLKIRDRPLRICHAKLDTTPSKPKEARPKRDFPQKRMASSPSGPSPGRSDEAKATRPSYQGLRASKSDIPKKSGIREKTSFRSPSSGYGNRGSKRAAEGTDTKVRNAKRPAVAARKAKLLNKRKQESATPENTHRSKKARKH